MGGELLAQILGAAGGLAGVGAILGWFSDRRKRKAEGQIADATVKANVRITDTASLQAQLAYLEKIIENLGKHNDKLQQEIEAAEERERKWMQRVRELEEEVNSLRRNASALQDQCDQLERKLTNLAKGM